MNKIKKYERKIEDLKKKIESEKIKQAQNKRWRAEEREGYWFVDTEGDVCLVLDSERIVDTKRWEAGNYFRTTEEAKNSHLYHVLNSEYFYWMQGEPKPDERPEGCEYLNNLGCWRWSISDVNHWVEGKVRRWPKNPEIIDKKEGE